MNQRMTSKYDRDEAEYFQWLCNIVQADEPDHSYLILMKILLHQINKHEEFLFDERGIDVLQYYEIDRILPKRWRKELEKNGEVYLANPTTKTLLLIKEWNFNSWTVYR